MNRFFYIISAILITAFMSIPVSAEEPRLPDIDRVMKTISGISAYKPYLVPGTDQVATDDQYVSNASEIFITRDHIAYGFFYKDSGSIDSAEEYSLAAYLLGRKLPYPQLQKVFDEEFPKGAEGYYRMTSLWYKTYNMNTNYNESAKNAIPLVIKHAAKNGITITEASAKEYYEKAVKNSLSSAFRSELGKAGFKIDAASLEKIISPWFEYFTSPSDDKFTVITTGRNCIEDISKTTGKERLLQAYDNAVLKFAGETFHYSWTCNSARSYFYEEDIERVYKNYFADIPLFAK